MAHYDEQREVLEVKKQVCQQGNINAVGSQDWYDYQQRKAIALPPVGAKCEYTLAVDSWHPCEVVSQNKLVLYTPLAARSLQLFNPDDVQFRPLDWDRPISPEFSFHLANCFNELKAAIGLLHVPSTTHEMLSHSLRLIEEVKGGA